MVVRPGTWLVAPHLAEVAAGRVRFVAHHRSGGIEHELAMLLVGADGEKREVAEIENVCRSWNANSWPISSPCSYELACPIAPGDAGSTVDHYCVGMHNTVTVR